MGRSRRPTRPKAPRGEERKNQLDLFFDWAVEAAKKAGAATAAAAGAAKDAATKKIEELWAAFDKRSLTACGVQAGLLVACSYREPSLLTLTVVVAATLSALLLAMPWIARRVPSHAHRAARGGSSLTTVLLIVSMFSLSAEIAMPWWSPPAPPAQQTIVPEAEARSAPAPPDEKSVAEEALREAAALAEKEAARAADCLRKENATQTARRIYSRREKDFAKCRTQYESAITIKSLDAYCGNERGRLDAAGRALDAAVGTLCSSTGSTTKSR